MIRPQRHGAPGAVLLAVAGTMLLSPMPVLSQGSGPSRSTQQRQGTAASDSHGFVSATRFGQQDGGALYAATCAGCHMPDGRGAVGAGAYPALAGNQKLEFAAYPISIVLNGFHGMPGFASQMDDRQVAEVVNWVRTNLGNNYTAEPATPEEVKAARQ
ncbi:c-type cytochrome [Roseomonas xinghualingensis]|uniref:c-type cytochrome n=1 Tax=Roseomonas xinghualingensis TaxID=2986475 RepID=UPI0021F24E06|nr:cytochrome c [Roseomonas sp. SXEYE001]MCV4206167.1 cytochrome c [Roseomonas sp. SXEYE001]